MLSVRPAHGLHVAGRQAGVIGETALEHGRAGGWMGHTAVGGEGGVRILRAAADWKLRQEIALQPEA